MNKHQIFQKGSTTYFYSSLFFPEKTREEVFALYAFVRVIDDFVDLVPQKRKEYFEFKKEYYKAHRGRCQNRIITDFIELARKKKFKKEWIDAFFESMEMDLDKKKYLTMADTDEYMYGSAEVIGLFMHAILGLPKESEKYARLLGKAMQYMNFIRDIAEDQAMGRTYFPKNELDECGLTSLDRKSAERHPRAFERFVRMQISHYREWQKEAEKGFKYLPKQYKIPVMTASEMYRWTSAQIEKKPAIVYSKKVKPSRIRIVANIGLQMVLPGEKND